MGPHLVYNFEVFLCQLKWGYLQIIHFNRIFQYKPSILGYHHLWKQRCQWISSLVFPCRGSVPFLQAFWWHGLSDMIFFPTNQWRKRVLAGGFSMFFRP